MRKSIKLLSIMATFGMLFSTITPVYAAGSHGSNSLFNFHSSKNETKSNYNSNTETFNNEAPISNTINTGKNTIKRMIVKTKRPLTADKQKALLGKNGTFNRSLDSVLGFSAYIPEKNVEILLRDPDIENIYIDSVVTAMGYPQPNPSSTVSAPIVWEQTGNKGSGVGVAILDTGVYPHKDLSSVIAFKDMVNGKTNAYDDNGHGTHVAGIVSGNGQMSENKYIGTAPKANIVSVKVLDSNEKGYISNVIAGIDWVIDNKDKYNIKVLNLSLGTAYSGGTDPLIESVEKATKSGIFVVVAAGNNGYGGKVTSPAVAPTAMAVGSTNSNNTVTPYDDVISSFSVKTQNVNGMSKPEIFAPGQDIVSLLAPEGSRAMSDRGSIVDGWYYKTSGTSMSAPVVSAAASLLYAKNPNFTPAQVKRQLVENGINVNGVNMLNVAKSFGLQPSFEEKKADTTTKETEQPKSEPTVPVFNSTPDTDTQTPVQDSNYDTGDTSAETPVFQPQEGKKEETPSFSTTKEEASSEDTNSFAVDNTVKPNAAIPSMNDYQIDNGYPFVKETYDKKNILEVLVQNSDQYKNDKEIKYEYENVQDIVKLFNLINRSFTKEDFLYFEQRMKN